MVILDGQSKWQPSDSLTVKLITYVWGSSTLNLILNIERRGKKVSRIPIDSQE